MPPPPGGGGSRGPDGSRGGPGGNQGPPDLDELWRNFNRKLNELFG
ncbi:MAG TPA: protease modulator HflK N-terminal domain-containing protein, partial [Burkholderiales bacterium]|nr:protease modulator HflK N-terminal domain-containing protein [Burkholderiales bacterium]